jgi:hypothetical protein
MTIGYREQEDLSTGEVYPASPRFLVEVEAVD